MRILICSNTRSLFQYPYKHIIVIFHPEIFLSASKPVMIYAKPQNADVEKVGDPFFFSKSRCFGGNLMLGNTYSILKTKSWYSTSINTLVSFPGVNERVRPMTSLDMSEIWDSIRCSFLSTSKMSPLASIC